MSYIAVNLSSVIGIQSAADAIVYAPDNVSKAPLDQTLLTVNFVWDPLGPEYTYPDTGGVSRAFKAAANTLLTFTAQVASIPAFPRSPVAHLWDFGDGARGFGPVTTHTFTVVNEHVRVTLTVIDTAGKRYTAGHQMLLY